jgi:LmbE family N-acetylglucosaminyl deacetylase
MFRLDLAESLSGVSSVLFLGAHCDDIEIGCGGTVLELLGRRSGLSVDWVVLSCDEIRAAEAQGSAEAFLKQAERKSVAVEAFRERYFPWDGGEIKQHFDSLGRALSPDVVFTHRAEDMHQDHRVVAELTRNTFRESLILEYEIPKWEGDLGRPNLFVHLEPRTCEQKIELLSTHFASQADKHWFDPETFRGLMRLRGLESKSPSGYAEGFSCWKLALG